jgi:hypothetical protein
MSEPGSKVTRAKHYDGTTRVQLSLDDGNYIEIVPGGRLTYLWVGSDKVYFSTTRPPSKAALRQFAKAILKEASKK